MEKVYSFFIFCIAAFLVYPQSGNLRGTIKTQDGKPAELVNITLEGTSEGSVTNSSGEFEIDNIPAGTYNLIISHTGFESKEIKVSVESGKTTFLHNIFLTLKATELEEVIVQDKKNKFENIESDYVSRLSVKNIENPQSYSTTTTELLSEQNIVNTTSAMQTIPGGVLTAQDPSGITGLFVRGFLTRTYIRNGLYTLSNNGGELQTVERLELIKGPSGSIFGTSGVSYGGLINKVTKKPFTDNYLDAELTFGSYNLQRLSGDFNIPLNDEKTFLLRLNAVAHYEGSFQDYGFKRSYLFAPSFYYKLNDNIDLFFDAEINSTELFSPTRFNGATTLDVNSIDEIKTDYFKSYISQNPDNKPTHLNNYYSQMNIYFSHNWKLSANLALADINLNGSNLLPRFINDSLMIRRLYDFNGQYNTINLQPYITGDFLLGAFRNRLIVGIDYRWAKFQVSQFFNLNIDTIDYTKDAVPLLNLERVRMNYNLSVIEDFPANSSAIYFSDFFSVNKYLTLMLGLRFERIDNEGTRNLITGTVVQKPFNQDALSPQAGITYELIDDKVSLFTNFMRGYDFVPPGQGQNFKPELGDQLEGGIKINLSSSSFSATVSYYNIEVKDKIRPDINNPPFFIQDGTQLSKGFDVDMRISPLQNLDMIMGYCFNESKFTKAETGIEGNRPPGTPKHTANFWGSYTFNKDFINGIGIGAGFTFCDEYFYDDRNSLTIPSYIIYRSSIFYNTSKFRINLTAENFTDEKYWDYLGTPQMPRRILASISLIMD